MRTLTDIQMQQDFLADYAVELKKHGVDNFKANTLDPDSDIHSGNVAVKLPTDLGDLIFAGQNMVIAKDKSWVYLDNTDLIDLYPFSLKRPLALLVEQKDEQVKSQNPLAKELIENFKKKNTSMDIQVDASNNTFGKLENNTVCGFQVVVKETTAPQPIIPMFNMPTSTTSTTNIARVIKTASTTSTRYKSIAAGEVYSVSGPEIIEVVGAGAVIEKKGPEKLTIKKVGTGAVLNISGSGKVKLSEVMQQVIINKSDSGKLKIKKIDDTAILNVVGTGKLVFAKQPSAKIIMQLVNVNYKVEETFNIFANSATTAQVTYSPGNPPILFNYRPNAHTVIGGVVPPGQTLQNLSNFSVGGGTYNFNLSRDKKSEDTNSRFGFRRF